MKRFFRHLLYFDLLTSLYLYIAFKLSFLKIASITFNKRKLYLRPQKSDFMVLNQVLSDDQYAYPKSEPMPKVILDGGANIGVASLFFAKQFPEARIFCFEPDTENFEVLHKNVSQYEHIHPFKKGLWSTTCKIHLNKKSGTADFFVTEVPTPNTVASIDCVSIEDFMLQNNLNQIDILKLDIEGAEYELLQPAFNHWISKVRCLMIETHDRYKPGSAKALFNTLAAYDFDLEVSGETLKFFNIRPK